MIFLTGHILPAKLVDLFVQLQQLQTVAGDRAACGFQLFDLSIQHICLFGKSVFLPRCLQRQPLCFLRIAGGQQFDLACKQSIHPDKPVKRVGPSCPFEPVRRFVPFLIYNFSCLREQAPTFVLGERFTILSLPHQYGNLLYDTTGRGADFHRIKGNLSVFHFWCQVWDITAASVGALHFTEDTLPDDTGKSDAPGTRLEILGHAIGFQALVLSVSAPIPVVEQGRQGLVTGSGDGLSCIVNFKKAVSVGCVILVKEPLGQIPKFLIHLCGALLHIAGCQVNLVCQLFAECSKKDFFGRSYLLPVFVGSFR